MPAPFKRKSDTLYRAILASSLGLYYRHLETAKSDLTWNETPAEGLA